MPPVTDAVLGSRFWLVNDFAPLGEVQNAGAQPNAPVNVKHDAAVFSFVANEGDEMVRSAINRAEMFAAQHTLADNAEEVELVRSNEVAQVLLPNNKDTFIDEAAQLYTDKGLEGNALQLCTKAFEKLMLTEEFSSRAEAGGALGEKGKAALMNAVLGLAKMLSKGAISESAVVELANGRFYDASNATDLLRLAADSAKKVRETFVGKAKFDAVIAACEAALAGAQDLDEARRDELEGMLAQLRNKKEEAIAARRNAVSFIKTNYLFTDPTGAVKSDAKFQSKQLDQIRDSLRAFRYNADQRRGYKNGFMEGVRRYFDNWKSNIANKDNLLSADAYRTLQGNDDNFNEVARAFFQMLRPADNPDDLFAAVAVNDSAADATRLSHLTNDRIRYHYSGIEQREKKSAAELRNGLAGIESGGSRTVTLSAGFDVLIGIDADWAKLNAKAGADINFTAAVNVNDKDGRVDVTYSIGGGLHGGATAQIGGDPDSEKDEDKVAGLGVKAEAGLRGSRTSSVTKTYANIDEFVRTLGPHSRLVNHRVREYIYTFGKDVVKGIGHGVMLGLTKLGFRISRSNMDQVDYSAKLRDENVFGQTAGILLRRRNTEILSKKKSVTWSGGAYAQGEGGVYFLKGEGKDSALATDKKLGGGISYDYSRTWLNENKRYSSFAKSLAKCSANYLEGRLNVEIDRAGQGDAEYTQAVRNLVTNARTGTALAEALTGLSSLIDRFEADSTALEKGETDQWRIQARRARVLAVAVALMARRAENFDRTRAAAAASREYLLQRLANPVVEFPEDIFLEELNDAFDMSKPVKSRHVTRFTFTYDLFQSGSEDLLAKGVEKTGVGNVGFVNDIATSAPGSATLESLQGDVADFGREMAGLNGKVELLLIKENNLATVPDKRPWENANTFAIEARIPDALPLRLLIELIVRNVVKRAAGTEEINESQLRTELKDAFLDTMKTTGEKALVDGGAKLLGEGVGKLAEIFPAFGKLLGALTVIGPKYDSTDDTFKTLRFNFVGGRFSNFSLSEDYEYKAKFSLKPLPFLDFSFGMSSDTKNLDYLVYTKPPLVAMLGVAANYNDTGNQEAFTTFLTRNQKGVARVMRAASDLAPNEDDDPRWRADRDAIRASFLEVRNLLTNVSLRNDPLGMEARLLMPRLEEVINAARNVAPDAEFAEMRPIAQTLFSLMAKAYTMAEMSERNPL